MHVKSSGIALGLANAWPLGSEKFAYATPPELKRQANAQQQRTGGGGGGGGGGGWAQLELTDAIWYAQTNKRFINHIRYPDLIRCGHRNKNQTNKTFAYLGFQLNSSIFLASLNRSVLYCSENWQKKAHCMRTLINLQEEPKPLMITTAITKRM